MCTPKNLVLLTLSTVVPLMVRGACRECTLLKSRQSPSSSPHSERDCCHCTTRPGGSPRSCSLSSSLLLMRPTTVVSSANLMKRLELYDGVQSWVSRVKRRGLSTHPWGVWTLLGQRAIVRTVALVPRCTTETEQTNIHI